MIIPIIVANIIMGGVFVLNYSQLPPQIPLFYSLQWGESQLTDTIYIVLIPIIMHIFVIINGYIYNTFFFPDNFIKKIITVSNIGIIIVCTTIFTRIILLVS